MSPAEADLKTLASHLTEIAREEGKVQAISDVVATLNQFLEARVLSKVRLMDYEQRREVVGQEFPQFMQDIHSYLTEYGKSAAARALALIDQAQAIGEPHARV